MVRQVAEEGQRNLLENGPARVEAAGKVREEAGGGRLLGWVFMIWGRSWG